MIAIVLALMLQGAPMAAQDVPLPDATQEARAQALMRETRCMVCENEPVSQSTADMAVDARRKIREQVAKGASDSEIRDFFVTRYGQYVSFRPPTNGWAMLLWAFPFALLAGAGLIVGLGKFRHRHRELAPVPDDRNEDGV